MWRSQMSPRERFYGQRQRLNYLATMAWWVVKVRLSILRTFYQLSLMVVVVSCSGAGLPSVVLVHKVDRIIEQPVCILLSSCGEKPNQNSNLCTTSCLFKILKMHMLYNHSGKRAVQRNHYNPKTFVPSMHVCKRLTTTVGLSATGRWAHFLGGWVHLLVAEWKQNRSSEC